MKSVGPKLTTFRLRSELVNAGDVDMTENGNPKLKGLEFNLKVSIYIAVNQRQY